MLPDGWLRGLVSGVEAAVLGWLTLVVPALAAYVGTAAAPALGEASWQSAAGAGAALWLLGHGGDMTAGSGVVSVVPLGITLLSLGIVYATVRRGGTTGYAAGSFAVLGYVLTMLVVSVLAPGGRWGALLGGVLVSGIGTVLAVRHHADGLPRWWADCAPGWVRDGLRGAGWALLGLTGIGTCLVVAGLVTGWDRVRMIQDSYLLDPFNTVLMTLAQMLFLPALAMWAIAWAAGPGFAVGSHTHFAAGDAVTAPLPAIPALGALPEPEAPGPQWVLVLPVLVGVVAGVVMHRYGRERELRLALGSAGVAAAVIAIAVAVLTYASAGSIGPGRMAVVGAQPPAVAGMVLAETGGALVLVVLALHRRTAELLGLGTRAARARVVGAAGQLSERRGRPEGDDTAAAPSAASPAGDPGAVTGPSGASAGTPGTGEIPLASTDLVGTEEKPAQPVGHAESAGATETTGSTEEAPDRDEDSPDGKNEATGGEHEGADRASRRFGGWSGLSLSAWSRRSDG